MDERELQRQWRRRKRAEGFCGECFREKAGGEGGTGTLCPTCAPIARARNRKRPYVPKNAEHAGMKERIDPWKLMELADKLRPMRISAEESLRRKPDVLQCG